MQLCHSDRRIGISHPGYDALKKKFSLKSLSMEGQVVLASSVILLCNSVLVQVPSMPNKIIIMFISMASATITDLFF